MAVIVQRLTVTVLCLDLIQVAAKPIVQDINHHQAVFQEHRLHPNIAVLNLHVLAAFGLTQRPLVQEHFLEVCSIRLADITMDQMDLMVRTDFHFWDFS